MKYMVIELEGCGSGCRSFITTSKVNYYKCLKTGNVFYRGDTEETGFPLCCPLPEELEEAQKQSASPTNKQMDAIALLVRCENRLSSEGVDRKLRLDIRKFINLA